MRRMLIWTAAAAAVLGCQSLAKKHDNPVLQPPPRRTSLDDTEAVQRLADAGEQSDIQQTAADDAGDDSEIINARVVARVNGAPVFAGEVLEVYGPFLNSARQKMPAERFVELREALIRRDLKGHIQRKLLSERMKSSLKPEQVKQLEQQVDRAFDKEIDRLKGELKVSTRTELELALNERNTTLAAVRDNFRTKQIAMAYLASKIERPPMPTRPDLIAYYQEHLDDYTIPARVKWQQIQASFDRKTTKSDARKKIDAAQQALQKGTPFEQVAQQQSDGPTAKSGGNWDWTQSGSLADEKLEKLLFELPVGDVSTIFEGAAAFHIVRVQDRQVEGRKPFGEVQDEIQQKLMESRAANLPQKFVEQLYSEAVIETEYELGDKP